MTDLSSPRSRTAVSIRLTAGLLTLGVVAGLVTPPARADEAPAAAGGSDTAATASDSAPVTTVTPIETPAASSPPRAAVAETPLAKTLRLALEKADLAAVHRVVLGSANPLTDWLDARIDEHLAGKALTQSWTVEITPAMPGNAELQNLRIVAKRLSGGEVETSALVRAISPSTMLPVVSTDTLSLPIVSHNLSVTLSPDGSKLQATDTITVGRYQGRTFVVRLAPSLKIADVTMGKTKVPVQRLDDTVYLTLPPAGKDNLLTVRYDGTWNNGPYDFIGARSTLLRPESAWYPQPIVPTNPVGFKVTAKGPTGVAVVASGSPKNGAYEPAKPMNGIALMAGRWQVRTKQIGNVQVRVLLLPESANRFDSVFAETANVLKFATQQLGTYPYNVLTIAETDVAGGYGGESVVSLGTRVLAGRRSLTSFLAHEILHSWTDRLLARGTEGEIGFISEGLTTYLAYQYVAAQPGNDATTLRQTMTLDYLRYHGLPEDVAIRKAQASVGTGPWFGVVYQKGAMAFHDLYQLLGARRYWPMMKTLFGAFADKPVRVADLQRLAEQANGEPLNWWFGQWLDRAGCPQFALQDVQVEKTGNGYRVTGGVSQAGTPYRVDLPLVVTTTDGEERFHLSLMREQQPFAVVTKTLPRAVRLDPDYQILSTRRRPPALLHAKAESVLVVIGTQSPDVEERLAAESVGVNVSNRYQGLGVNVSVAKDTEVTQAQLAAAPLVVLVGRPGLNAWTAKLPELPVPLANDRFSLAGTTYDKPEHGIVESLTGPWGRDQVVTVFGGLGAPALRQMAAMSLGSSPLEVVVAGNDRVVEAGSYPMADPELTSNISASP